MQANKKYKPRYNSLMKNPLSYTYVKISKKDDLTDIEVTGEVNHRDGALYFGPYTSRSTVERGIEGIKECYGLLCSNSNKKSSSPCLNYSLGLCIGICIDDEARKKYSEIVEKVIDIINGSYNSIVDYMTEKMNSASESFDFERAARYRDYIKAVNYLIAQNKVAEYFKENKNIILAESLDENLVKVFLLAGNKVLYSQSYRIKDYTLEQLISELKEHIEAHFSKDKLPLYIVSAEDIDEAQIIYSYLKKENNRCRHLELDDNSLTSLAIDKDLADLIYSDLKNT